MSVSWELPAAADGLEPGPDGIWVARLGKPVSYPEAGNANCLALEEDSFWFAHRNRCIEAVLRRFPPTGMLFDIGGGNGYVAAGLIQAGFPTALVEPGWDGVQNARMRGVRPLICATLETARFQPSALPAVGLFDVLEHIKDDAGFLRQVRDYLIPDGRVYLTVPAFRWLWSAVDEFSGHARRYTRPSLMHVLEQAGLRVEYTSYMFSMLPLPMLAQRLLPFLLGRRKASDWSGYRSEHARRSGLTGAVLARWLHWEQVQFRHGKQLPFGSSVLAVAKKVGSV